MFLLDIAMKMGDGCRHKREGGDREDDWCAAREDMKVANLAARAGQSKAERRGLHWRR